MTTRFKKIPKLKSYSNQSFQDNKVKIEAEDLAFPVVCFLVFMLSIHLMIRTQSPSLAWKFIRENLIDNPKKKNPLRFL